MIEKSQKKIGEYTYKITLAKKCEFTIAWKIKIRKVCLICFLKNIYGMNGENMTKKGESPYNTEQVGNHGWLWTTHLNHNTGGS